MRSRQTEVREFLTQNHPWLLLSLFVFIGLFLGEPGSSLFQYQRQAILDGGLHRLVTGHLVHTNTYHALLNLAGLLLIGFLSIQHIRPQEWWWALLISMLSVSLGLLVFDPEIMWYRGLSGVLHAIVVVLVIRARQLAMLIRGLILLCLVVKVILEQGNTGFWQNEEMLGAVVVVNAHLYGILGGLLAAIFLQLTRKRRMFREHF